MNREITRHISSDDTVELDASVQVNSGPGRMAIRWFTEDRAPTYQVLDDGRSTIGRGSSVSLSLAAAGVSRQHAEVYRQGPAYVFHDTGSTNGSWVNGERVEYAALSEGHVLRVGDAVGVTLRLAAGATRPQGGSDLVELGPGMVFGPGLAQQVAALARVGPSDLPIVIVGETGTGKEFLARAAHLLSGRRGELHAVNCAALPAALAEAELFGHTKGAYTGAEQASQGHVRAADKGTLFLDELPELSAPIQAKLLRVIQERQVTPLGETRPIKVDLRIVVAGQRPLGELVEEGKLRQDLAARLSGLVVEAAPLRDRRVDIGLLFRHFFAMHTQGRVPPTVDPRLLESLLLYRWPGNVRELELLVRRLIALHGHEPVLRRSHLPPEMRGQVGGNNGGNNVANNGTAQDHRGGPATPKPLLTTGDRDEHDLRRLIVELRRAEGNVSRASTAAGISRARAYRLMGDRTVADLLGDPALS